MSGAAAPLALSELQEDALAEMINIGVGHSAASLSQMVGEEILLSVPFVEFKSHAEVASQLREKAGDSIVSIKQDFTGAFWGDAMLIFPESNSLELVKALLQDDTPLDVLSDMEQDALVEVGNVILTGCLSSMSNLLQGDIDYNLPRFNKGSPEDLLAASEPSSMMLFIRLDFSMPSRPIKGYIAFAMDVLSLEQLRGRVDTFLSS